MQQTKHTEELAAEICRRLADGKSLRAICRELKAEAEALGDDPDALPTEAAVRGWALDDINGFAAHYTRARQIGIHHVVDDALDRAAKPTVVKRITDETTEDGFKYSEVTLDGVDRDKLYVDTVKWYAGKLAPKVYGDVSRLDLGNADGEAFKIESADHIDPGDAARLLSLLTILEARSRGEDDGSDLV